MVELVIVIVLIAILSTTAALSLRPIMQRRELNRAVQQITLNDSAARATARRLNQPALLTIDSRAKRAEYLCAGRRRRFSLPGNVEVDQIVGIVRSEPLWVGRDGRSATYAVALSIGEATRWVLIAGGSGQTITAAGPREVGDLLGARQ